MAMLLMLLVLTGWVIGFVGAMVGAGGGFLLMPILLLALGLAPARASGVSLVMVTVSAVAGTWAYLRQRQVDVPTGLVLAAFAIPGTALGARLAGVVSPGAFSVAFGLLLAIVGGWMAAGRRPQASAGGPDAGRHSLVTMTGEVYRCAMPLLPLSLGAVLIGGLASLFGIGGGPLLVPLLTLIGGMPVHIAAATSQLVILLSSAAGVAGYLGRGGLDWHLAAALSAGALLGAPLGAGTAPHVPARRLLQLLGLCLVLAGGRLMVK